MKTLALMLTLLPPAMFGVGTVTVTNTSGSAQQSAPVSISRVFRQGDIANFAQPAIGGTALQAWQCDVKTRWRDNSKTMAIQAATASSPIVITAAGHGFRSGEMVTISGVQGNTAANGTWRIFDASKDTFALVNSTGKAPYRAGSGSVSGPAPGSVQHAIISFTAPLPGRGAVAVDFVNNVNPSSAGNQASTDRVALDGPGMLAFNGGNWGAVIEAVQGATHTADARRMIANGHFFYWLRGPVVTQAIAEGPRTDAAHLFDYDFGWSCQDNCTGDYSQAKWADDTSIRSLHPIFVMTFYPVPGNAVKLEYILENMWTTKLQDQRYDLRLLSGNAAPVPRYKKSKYTHYAGSRWRKVFWDPAPAPTYNVNFDFAYMIASKAVVNYDQAKSADVGHAVGAFNSTDKGDLGGSAQWMKAFPSSGARPDIGLLAQWYTRYLYSFDKALVPVVLGNAAVSGHIPIHWRESDPSLKYDDRKTVGALGRPYSLDARPTGWLKPVKHLSNAHGWVADMSHQSDFAYLPYLVTGDWYFLEELQFWAAFNGVYSVEGTCYYCRHDSWGYVTQPNNTRGRAWGDRAWGHAGWTAPDGTPEKTYYLQKELYNIAVNEGKLNITDGAFFNTPQWQWGREVVGKGNPIGSGPNPLGFIQYDSSCVADNSPGLVRGKFNYCEAPWMYNYLNVSWGHLGELGFPNGALRKALLVNLLHQLADPAYNPYLAGAFHFPVIGPDNDWYKTWKDVFEAFSPEARSRKGKGAWCDLTPSSCDDGPEGYPLILHAAASFLPALGKVDGMDGKAAWEWVSTHMNTRVTDGDPRWAILPRAGDEPSRAEPKSPAKPTGGGAQPSR